MSWAVDIDPARKSAEQDNPAPGKRESLSASDQEDRVSYNESSIDGQSEQGSILDGQRPGKIVIPTAKQIRKATIEGIKLGVLPEYQDYTVVLAYLVKEFIAYDFDFCEVQSRVPWFSEWISNPFNEATLDKELELAARLEASRIYDRIQFLVEGGICSKTLGRISGLCYCIPMCRVTCRVKAYCLDLLLSCVWSTCFDWWLGILPHVHYLLHLLCAGQNQDEDRGASVWRRHVRRRGARHSQYLRLEQLSHSQPVCLPDAAVHPADSVRPLHNDSELRLPSVTPGSAVREGGGDAGHFYAGFRMLRFAILLPMYGLKAAKTI